MSAAFRSSMVRFLFLAVALAAPSPARAKSTELKAPTRISAVTVFLDRAQVVRSLDQTVPAGESTLVIEGLPAGLIEESLRVTGVGAGKVLIGSLETRRAFGKDLVQEEERRYAGEIESLNDRIALLDKKIAAQNDALIFIRAIAQNLPKAFDQDLVTGKADPAKWKEAWTSIGGGSAVSQEAIQEAEVAKRELKKTIDQKQKELDRIRTGAKETLEARIHLEAQEGGRVALDLSYQLAGASWSTLYDARLNVEKGETLLTHKAQVLQRSGEDWSGVGLTLSTARPSTGGLLPRLDSWYINFAPPPMSQSPQKMMPASAPMERKGNVSADSSTQGILSLPSKAEPVQPLQAEIQAGEFSLEYRIPGNSDVPSDGEPHQFNVTDYTLACTPSVLAVPRMDPNPYLYSEIRFTGETPLPVGPVSIFRDGAFIGKSRLDLIRPGQSFKLGFGLDDKVRIEYIVQNRDYKSQEGLINKKERLERSYLIKIANHHSRPITVDIQDQQPVAGNEKIEVELLEGSTKPTWTQIENQKGVVGWTKVFQPQERWEIQFGYSVTWPQGERIQGL